MSEENKVEVYGVNADGTEVFLGHAASTPPGIKRREIVANYFCEPNNDPDDCSEANSCLWALEDYHNWLVEQGWTGPKLEIQPPKGRD